MKRSYNEISTADNNAFIKKRKLLPTDGNTDFLNLHKAIFAGDLEQVKQLNSVGVSTKIAEGYTLMHIAAACGQIKIMKWLKYDGHVIDATNVNGYTPLYIAASYGELGSVEWLLKNGARVTSFKNFKFMDDVVLKSEKVVIISELLNWTLFADEICN